MRRLAGSDLLNRPTRIIVDLAALDLAEMQVIDRPDPAEEPTVGPRQGADLVVADVMDGVRLEIGETHDDAGGPRLMGHDQIVGDGRDVHAVEGSGARGAPSGEVARAGWAAG
jgi:hypothetical protein